jgi:DnaJ-domain-containing protein 1
MNDGKQHDRFQGRVRGAKQACAHAGCREDGEFRAPNPYGRGAGPDGPGDYQFLCLDHVRAFNARFNFFEGMSREEIEDAQLPAAGWANASRIYTDGGVDSPPKWRDFHDPLDAISARFRDGVSARSPKERQDGKRLSDADRRALSVLGLDVDADRKALRARYSALVRQYHPDRNGGDRTHEKALQTVVEAYQALRGSPAFL